jgi:hypothetical protein
MDWTKILADAGIPEPPGRAEALVRPVRWWRATLRKKKGGAVRSEKVEAATYHEALAECRQRFKDCSLICLTECEPS